MFRVSFSPLLSEGTLTVIKFGEKLTINGDTIDLSVIPDSATVKHAHVIHPFLVDKIERINGVINLTVRLPYIADGHVKTPVPITVTTDGSISLPEVRNG